MTRLLPVAIGLILLWQALVWVTAVPPYILPGPLAVAVVFGERWAVLAEHAGVTVLEILLGLLCGAFLGALSALMLSLWRPARRWLLPVFVVSQSIPVFALAPILVLWMGYGLASKVAMATLIIYFPVTAAFYDGLRQTEPGWLDMARVMGGRPWRMLWHIRVPSALPRFASGLRVATAVAPIGAIVGEWVGSSKGLGYLMLHANGRMQVDFMFAALFLLAAFSVGLYFTMDAGLSRLTAWAGVQEREKEER